MLVECGKVVDACHHHAMIWMEYFVIMINVLQMQIMARQMQINTGMLEEIVNLKVLPLIKA